ncbi:MAG: putative addiction module antidote protein [bacterium]|nr:putative addiction module antidote protein [bacterium]
MRAFDECVEEHLKENPGEIGEFIETALEEYEKDRDETALLMALRQAAKANGGMTALARKTNLSRESLYKTLSPSGNPRLKNLLLILESFGYSLSFKPIKSAR